ncbi:NAD(P)-binding protein [Thelephora terrestris]|uniref:enoyl-[acyl-carrier-protein] reductase n=1 Tax=Thelephora terrestris TaxID=56493 RepID=A0A9P6LDZ8_9AGAM|nr:NAD(P)-binding protein [Thelephora terrestris]
MAVRAIVYERNGDPASVLRTVTFPPEPLSRKSIRVKVLLSLVNPSDLHVVHGSYAIQPDPREVDVNGKRKTVYLPGNEGLGEIAEVGPDVESLKSGDWVVFSKSQSGTWSSGQVLEEDDVIKIDEGSGISAVTAATLTVNPATAYKMLTSFVDLKPGDWIAQNAANSSAGQAVIQLASARGIHTINLIRKKDDFAKTERLLKDLGADVVLTYDDVADDERAREVVGDKEVRLLLDCVGGQGTKDTLRLASKGSHLVVYGSMAQEDLRLPPFLLIFKDIHVRGFWRTGWFNSSTLEERSKFLDELVQVMVNSKFKEPVHEIVKIEGTLSDEEATGKVQEIFERVNKGTGGTKIILEVETPRGF